MSDRLYLRGLKRAFDLALAVPALVLAAPTIVGLAIGVRATSRGPAFFVQERIGRGRRPFRLVKLRTMVDGAERIGPQFTARGDPRTTALGALLRATKLDELPQLWNVVRGDMSFVGPRPEVARYTQRYRPEWERVFSVRPGITDAASIVFRHEEELLALAADRERAYVSVLLPLKLELALQGIERSSLVFDVSILISTVLAVLKRTPHAQHPALARARAAIAELQHEGAAKANDPEVNRCRAAS